MDLTSEFTEAYSTLGGWKANKPSERERQATIARNRAILAELDLVDAASVIKSTKTKSSAKPVQPRVKKAKEPVMPTRQSTRLRRVAIDPNESPAAKRKREVSFALFHCSIAHSKLCTSAPRRKADEGKSKNVWRPLRGSARPSDLAIMISISLLSQMTYLRRSFQTFDPPSERY